MEFKKRRKLENPLFSKDELLNEECSQFKGVFKESINALKGKKDNRQIVEE